MRLLFLATLVLAAGCAGGGAAPRDPGEVSETPKEAQHERFLLHPTVVKADAIRAIFPMEYRDEIEVSGLSNGWREEKGKRSWAGTAKAEVRLRRLVLSGPNISVTLVADQPEPDVMIQADGNVSFGHSVKGMRTERTGKDFLLIRNDAWLER